MMGKTLIIAEAGVNHNGSLELAKTLALEAKKCGADVVKFQTAKLDALVSKYAAMAEYQKKNIGQEMSQQDMLRKLLLTYEEFEELDQYCKKIDIQFLSTPFDLDSIDFLTSLNCSVWKIPSGEITNLPYLEKIAKTGKPVILSTGMCIMQEVEEAVRVLEKGTREITLLHCTTQYPTEYGDVNLKAMLTLQSHFGYKIGYSDHTRGVEVPLAAVALGASVIEKHFTLSRNMEGPDHKASLESSEFADMVRKIRNIEKSLGSEEKKPAEVEMANRSVARKSIIAARDIKKGEVFTESNLTAKRPGNGISPMKWYEILGTKAIRDFKEDELIEI